MKFNSRRFVLAVLALVAVFTFASCQTAEVPAPAKPVVVEPVVTPATEPVVTPVAEPVTVIEPVVETKENAKYSFQVYGMDMAAELVSPSQLLLTYPELVTDEELIAWANYIYEEYTMYLEDAQLQYAPGMGLALITFDYEITDEEFYAYAPYVADAIRAYVEALLAANPSYSFQIHGFDCSAELVASNELVLTYPEFFTEDELLAFGQFVYQGYTQYVKNANVVYGTGRATITLDYDVTDAEFNEYAPYVAKAIVSYVDSVVAQLDADAKAAEEAKAAALLAEAKAQALEAERLAKAAAEAEAAAKAAAEKAAAEKSAAAKAAAEAAAKAAEEAKAAAEAAAKAAEEAAAKAASDAAAEAEAKAKAENEAKLAAEKAAAEAVKAKKKLSGVIVLIIVICLAAAAGLYYFLVLKKKK